MCLIITFPIILLLTIIGVDFFLLQNEMWGGHLPKGFEVQVSRKCLFLAKKKDYLELFRQINTFK